LKTWHIILARKSIFLSKAQNIRKFSFKHTNAHGFEETHLLGNEINKIFPHLDGQTGKQTRKKSETQTNIIKNRQKHIYVEK
jgi:hypothetical protein